MVLPEEKGDCQLPRGEKGGLSDPLALWERVRVRVFHQGYAKGLSRSKGQG